MNAIAKNRKAQQDKMNSAREAQARQGGVVTRYGNYYTEEEWTEMQEAFDAQAAEAEDMDEAFMAIKREAARRMTEAGIEGYTFSIAARIFDNGLEGIEFSNEGRQQLVEEIDRWMQEEARKVAW